MPVKHDGWPVSQCGWRLHRLPFGVRTSGDYTSGGSPASIVVRARGGSATVDGSVLMGGLGLGLVVGVPHAGRSALETCQRPRCSPTATGPQDVAERAANIGADEGWGGDEQETCGDPPGARSSEKHRLPSFSQQRVRTSGASELADGHTQTTCPGPPTAISTETNSGSVTLRADRSQPPGCP